MRWPNHILIKISSWKESQKTLSLPWIQDVNWTNVYIYKSFNVFWTSYARLTYVLCPGSFKSSPPEVLCKKGVLRNFAKFRRKHLCHILLKLQAWGLQIYWKWDSGTCALLWIFLEFLRKSFSIEHLRWLLLEFKTLGDINSAIHRTSI